MDGITKKSPLSKEEYRNKYLKTLRYTPKSTVIDAVQPIRPAANQLNNPKPTLMFNIELMHEHTRALLAAHKNLNARGEQFRDMVKAFKEDPEGFMKQIKELVKQFNQTTASVLTFDRVFHTRHSETLGDLLGRQQFNLEKMGIRIIGINQLEFDDGFFKKAVQNSPDFFEAVFFPGLALFNKAFTIISGIHPPTEPPVSQNNSPFASIVQTSRTNPKG